MKLSQQDADLFFELMWALQFFVKQKRQMLPEIKTLKQYAELSNIEKKKPIRDALYENPELIDEFLRENPQKFSAEKLEIIEGWKHFVADTFCVERILKRYAVFIGSEDRVFGVLGLYDELENLMPKHVLPLIVKAVLLPFKDKIVYDGLFASYNVWIGGNMSANFKDTYMSAKQNQAIIESPRDLIQPSTRTRKVVSAKDWSEELEQLAELAKSLRGGQGQPPINSAAFSLIRASIEFAQLATSEDATWQQLNKSCGKVDRAVGKIYSITERM